MPITKFPYGVGVDDSNYMNEDGVIVGSEDVVAIVIASSSAAGSTYGVVPFAGTVEAVFFVQDAALPAVPGTMIVKIGSAGTTVGTVTLTSAGVAGGVQQGTGEASVAVTTANSLSVARITSGTAFSGVAGITIKRT